MKCQAIIAEYNPFHNGHRYLINTASQKTDADITLALMSGCFLQRGIAAMWDKYTRASMCVSSGVDFALELPFPYATGSAYDFANAAVNILNSLGCVDYLCFGAEDDDIDALNRICNILLDEPAKYSNALKQQLILGKPFPAARQAAIEEYTGDAKISALLKTPNNILAIEYLCALKRSNSTIRPVIIRRVGAGYHDADIAKSICSATAIRASLEHNIPNANINAKYSDIKEQVPKAVFNIIVNAAANYSCILPEDILPFLQSAILASSDLSNICDLSPELISRIEKTSVLNSYRAIIDSLKTKNITETRICRSLLHLIMGYHECDRDSFVGDGYAYYANILAINKSKTAYLKEIMSRSLIPMITKKADFNAYLSKYPHIDTENAKRMWQMDTRATDLYNCIIYNKYGYKADNDYTIRLPVL